MHPANERESNTDQSYKRQRFVSNSTRDRDVRFAEIYANRLAELLNTYNGAVIRGNQIYTVEDFYATLDNGSISVSFHCAMGTPEFSFGFGSNERALEIFGFLTRVERDTGVWWEVDENAIRAVY
jgi:hypothetical protein